MDSLFGGVTPNSSGLFGGGNNDTSGESSGLFSAGNNDAGGSTGLFDVAGSTDLFIARKNDDEDEAESGKHLTGLFGASNNGGPVFGGSDNFQLGSIASPGMKGGVTLFGTSNDDGGSGKTSPSAAKSSFNSGVGGDHVNGDILNYAGTDESFAGLGKKSGTEIIGAFSLSDDKTSAATNNTKTAALNLVKNKSATSSSGLFGTGESVSSAELFGSSVNAEAKTKSKEPKKRPAPTPADNGSRTSLTDTSTTTVGARSSADGNRAKKPKADTTARYRALKKLNESFAKVRVR